MDRSHSALGSLFFGFFLVANPAYFVSCSAEDDGFQYDEADMLQVVEQLNETESLDIETPAGLRGYQIDFQLQQASAASSDETALLPAQSSWVKAAHACESRTFVRSAAACVSSSSLLLEGTARIKDGEKIVQTLEVEGAMDVHSNLLTHAEFLLSVDDAQLRLTWTDEGGGTFSGVEVYGDDVLLPSDPGLGGAGGGR